MKPFLYETAEKIIKDYSDTISDIILIFPNKRTQFYFRKYLAEIFGKASLPPKMREIGVLIRELTGFKDADKLSLIFDLYRVFKKFDTKYEFENFYRLGEIILSDFNEIDAWSVNPEQIYQNIRDLKELDTHFDWLTDEQKEILKQFWGSFDTEKNSKEQEMFIKLWNLLPKVYKDFTTDLKNRKLAYNGLIYRYITELIEKDDIQLPECKKIIFIGFNALNKSEINLIKYFQKNIDTEFYWDYDTYYFDDKKQEAGDFLRKNINDLKLNVEDIPNLLNREKKVKVIGASLNINQAKILNKILEETENIENTAVITADEAMLFPILSSLPNSVDKINVTMGYAFKLTPLFNFISLFFRLHINADKNKYGSFHFKDVINIIDHPYIKEYNSKISEEIKNEIIEKNLISVSFEQILNKDNDLIKLLFSEHKDEEKSINLLNNLLDILFVFFDKPKFSETEKTDFIKNEYIFRAYKKIKRFREIIIENGESLSLKLMSEILLQILRTDSIPFESDSADGLQIMGLMESRNLDFKNVVILGMNEGNLPKISMPPTFISQSLRFAFGLPVVKFQDAVFAYFFYRLLQRSENITLIYNSLVSEANSGEMSRFITQIMYETKLNIQHYQYNDDISISRKPPTEIIKDEKVFERLQKYLPDKDGKIEKSFSPTAFNIYKSCSLKFYFRYIIGLKMQEEPGKDLSPAEFGKILHKALEFIYSDLKNESSDGIVSENDITEKIKNIEDYLLKAFSDHYKYVKNYKPSGIGIIIKNVLEQYIKRVLNYDIKKTPFEIVSLEDTKFNEMIFDIKINDNSTKVKFSGIIDRIDKKDDVYKIIDYKSGKEKNKIFKLNELFEGKNVSKFSDAFQTLFYTYVFKESSDFAGKKMMPELYYVQAMNHKKYSGTLTYKSEAGIFPVNEETLDVVLNDFTKELKKLTEEIFNSENTFKMTENPKNCEHCEFYGLCY